MLTDVRTALTPRPVAASVEELLAGATGREPFLHSDSKSGSAFERIVVDGERCVIKYVHVDSDWTMRLGGDVGCKPLQVWASGLMDVLPERVEHAVVGVASGLGRNGWGAAILMRDVSDGLVPEGDVPLDLGQHLAYLDTMAALAARTWGWADEFGLLPLANRYTWFGPANLSIERAHDYPDVVPKIADEGWARFFERAPRDVAALFTDLQRDVSPIVEALSATPFSFVHGDWKLGNVGTAADGRTILIDWTYPGFAPVCHDLGWYLALNRARLPHGKEDAIAAFKAAIGREGIDVTPWWDRQLGAALLGTLVQFGWEKAFGDDDEFGWWCDRAREGARWL